MRNDDEFLVDLGANIRKVRKDQGINQSRLAELCAFDKASLSRIESGKTNFTTLTLKKIGEALQVSVCDFFKNGK